MSSMTVVSNDTRDPILDGLREDFPREALKTRSGGGGKALTYVEGHAVINRLNRVVKSWDFKIESVDWRDFGGNGTMLVTVIGHLTIPGLGTRAGIGVQVVRPNSGEDLVKGAQTDALKKAAVSFGVAISLYGSDYEDEDGPTSAPAPRSSNADHYYDGGGNVTSIAGPDYDDPYPQQRTAQQAPPQRQGGAPPAPAGQQSYPPAQPGNDPTPRQVSYAKGIARENGVDIEEMCQSLFGTNLDSIDRRQMSRLIENINGKGGNR